MQSTMDDPRIKDLLGSDSAAARVAIVGFPSDEGVRRNGGRPGAAEAPDHIRRQLLKMTPDPAAFDDFSRLLGQCADLGHVEVTGDLESDQQRLGERLAPHLERGAVPIVLGGGHETAFGHFLGYVESDKPVAILNWDAHPDVRPLKNGRAHSGSPFRQALKHESGRLRKYTVAGLQPHSSARAHLDFIEASEGKWFTADRLSLQEVQHIYDGLDGPTLVTFDLDAVDHSAAPGVSAPAVDGLDPSLWLAAAYQAGRTPNVTSMDIVELNPRVDRDQRTARLAALTVWRFLQGLATRG